MIHINEMPMDFEPRRKILSKISEQWSNAENLIAMSEFESAFLCGAIKTFRPKKILEVGVLDGGSTSVILQALEDIGEPYEMHSVDIAAERPFKKGVETGFVAKFAKEKIFSLRGTHEFHLGKILPQVLDDIGGEIDFVILDTMHMLPGEVLDFIAVLPYLKEDALVVMHDVAVNQHEYHTGWCDAYSNAALFSAVTAEKFLNFDEKNFFRYPNIGAFKVSTLTAENIDNVFLTLILPWKYLPSQVELALYYQLYRKFYPIELYEIFKEAVDMNAFNIMRANRK